MRVHVLAVGKRSNFNLYNTESDQRFHVRGGNDQITTLLAKAVEDNIRTATPLVAIASLPDGKVRLSFKRTSGAGDATGRGPSPASLMLHQFAQLDRTTRPFRDVSMMNAMSGMPAEASATDSC